MSDQWRILRYPKVTDSPMCRQKNCRSVELCKNTMEELYPGYNCWNDAYDKSNMVHVISRDVTHANPSPEPTQIYKPYGFIGPQCIMASSHSPAANCVPPFFNLYNVSHIFVFFLRFFNMANHGISNRNEIQNSPIMSTRYKIT